MWNYAAGIPHPQPKFDAHGLSLTPYKSALWFDATGKRLGPTPLVTGFDSNELCRRVSALEAPHTWQVLNWRIAAKEFAISGSEHNPSIRDRKLFSFLKEVLFGNHELIKKISSENDHVIDAVSNYDAMLVRGSALRNDDQMRRIQQARAWGSDKVRTCQPQPILDQKSGPLIAIKLRLISRKDFGGDTDKFTESSIE